MPGPTTSTTTQSAVNFIHVYNHTGVPMAVVVFLVASILVVLAAGVALGMIVRRPRPLEAGASD